MEDRKVQKQAGESITSMFTVKNTSTNLVPGWSMKFICNGRWRRDCQVILFTVLREHSVVHTDEIPELGSLTNITNAHSDNTLVSVQNNRKQTCLRQTFTGNNERCDLTSGTIYLLMLNLSDSERLWKVVFFRYWLYKHSLVIVQNYTAEYYTCILAHFSSSPTSMNRHQLQNLER